MLHGANQIDAGGLGIEIKKNFFLFISVYWHRPAEQPAPKPTEANKILPMMKRLSDHRNRQIR
jgi:hypothetical protein